MEERELPALAVAGEQGLVIPPPPLGWPKASAPWHIDAGGRLHGSESVFDVATALLNTFVTTGPQRWIGPRATGASYQVFVEGGREVMLMKITRVPIDMARRAGTGACSSTLRRGGHGSAFDFSLSRYECGSCSSRYYRRTLERREDSNCTLCMEIA